MTRTGECMCGNTTLTIPDGSADEKSAYCHCTNCIKQSGAIGSVVMLMPEDDVKVSGPTKTYIDKKTDSGVDLERVFCGFCGSPVYSKTPQAPGKLFVKMGLFDDIPPPMIEVYTKNKQSWEPTLEGVMQVVGAPGS